MSKKITTKIFGRRVSKGEVVLTGISLTAATLTILQNLGIGTLSTGIESGVTKTGGSLWMLGLGILLILLTFAFIKRKK